MAVRSKYRAVETLHTRLSDSLCGLLLRTCPEDQECHLHVKKVLRPSDDRVMSWEEWELLAESDQSREVVHARLDFLVDPTVLNEQFALAFQSGA